MDVPRLFAFLRGLVVTVWFAGTPIDCIADTGAAHTIVTRTIANRLHTTPSPIAPVTIAGVAATKTRADVVRVPHVGTTWLGLDFLDILVVPDAHSPTPCLLGRDVLTAADITIRWAANTIEPAGP